MFRKLIVDVLPQPHQQHTVATDLAARANVLAANAAHGSHSLVLQAEALIEADCARCGRRALLAPTDVGDRCCRACWRAPTATCSICGRRRPCYGAAGPSPRCETCVKVAMTRTDELCGTRRVAGGPRRVDQ